MTNSLLEAALEYNKKGFSVVPLQPHGKAPLIKWEEFSTRKASEEEIRSWWRDNPNANVGIITGAISGLIAVDIDVERGGDAKRIFDIAPTNIISKTGKGGYHLLYKYDPSIPRNKVGKNGVDVRSNGGLIVAPPSIHNNGNQYKWIRTGNLGPITKSLVLYVDLPQVSSNSEQDSGQKWIADALLGVASGSRNDTCAKLAGYYAGKGIPKDVAIIMLTSWDNGNIPPLGNQEITTTVESVYRTSYKYTPPVLSEKAQSSNSFNTIDMNSYMREYGDNAVKWIVPEWLPEDTIAFAVSPPGTYKTWMLLDLAVSVASGTSFLSMFEVENKGPVLMIQQEDHHGGLAERLGVIINSRYKMLYETSKEVFSFNPPPKLPIYFHPDRQLKFNNPEVMDNLEKEIDRIRPKLVIIDPLYSAAETDDYMAKSAGQMFRLKKMRDKYHCTFIIAHHKKKKADGNEREGLWGSQFLNAFLETGWQIRSTSKTSVSILRHFKVKKESNELAVDFDIDTEIFPYKYEVSTKDAADEKELGIMKELEGGELSPAELAEKLGVNRTTVTRRIKLLLQDGTVIKTPEGKFMLLEKVIEY